MGFLLPGAPRIFGEHSNYSSDHGFADVASQWRHEKWGSQHQTMVSVLVKMCSYVWEGPVISCRWTGWVQERTGCSSMMSRNLMIILEESTEYTSKWPYILKWASWAIMRQSILWNVHWERSSCDFLDGFIIMCGCIECLSCILRTLNGYSLVPTSHLYVPITFPTLNWADQLAHFSWDGHQINESRTGRCQHVTDWI